MTSLRTRERLLARLQDKGIRDFQVLAALRDVPRHLFVDEALASRAYEDTALPIGHGQTISQPYVVARMTEALVSGGRTGRVLEIGTGCGYQSVVLAELFESVYTLERVDSLLRGARERFHGLETRNISARHADGHLGWADRAPFDGIMLCAAPAALPDPLLAQLAPGGRLVAPVGEQGSQSLLVVDRDGSEFTTQVLDQVAFVPMLQGMS